MNTFDTQLVPSILYLLATVFCTILLVLRWTYVWQLKEYRIDRMRDFFSLSSGKKTLVDVQFGLNALTLIVVSFTGAEWLWAAATLLVAQTAVLMRKRVQPRWTGKALGVAVVALAIVVVPAAFVFWSTDNLIWLPLALLLSPLVVSGLVISLHPVTLYQRRQVMARAHQKLQTLQTSVIGITGSFGKSTTKEFLKVMLSQRYSVVATAKNINVDIGIAQTILSELQPEHDFFIAEMGAYRPGEIASSCRVAQPIIGVLTAVAEQHLSLYGSLEAIQHAKGELLRALPAGGLAVVNKDIAAAVEVAEESQAQVKFYSVEGFAHAYAQQIAVSHDRVDFVLHIGEEHIPVSAQLYGAQVVPSILAAATVARHVGCTMQEIAQAVSQLTPSEGTMHVITGKHDTVVIDDHYNASPEGFMAALDYQDVFAGRRKIVITPGMYELADKTEYHHHSVAQRIAEVADVLMITKDDFAPYLTRGAVEAGMPSGQIVVHTKPSEAIEWLQKNLRAGDVVLLEGRVNANIVNYLRHN